MASPAKVRVVIVNYNTGDWLARCILALEQSTLPFALTIVDNASDDASAAWCRQRAAQSPEQVILNPANIGFGAACNQVALAADEPCVCFVNPDCALEPDALALLVTALAAQPGAAAAGALVLNEDGSLQRASLRNLPSPRRALVTALGLERWGLQGINITRAPPTQVQAVAAVSGAVMLVDTARFRAIGGFDEGYFLHCEDLDLFVRLQNEGWQLLLVPAAKARHALGVSQRGRPLAALACKHASLARYFSRHVAASTLSALLWRIAIGLHFLVRAPFVLLTRRP